MTEGLNLYLLDKFQCAADKCEDNCCYNWAIKLNTSTLNLYQKTSPSLLNTTEAFGSGTFFKLDSINNGCLNLEQNLCSIHKNSGEDYLADPCHFFPRIIRKLDQQIITTASLSCPEIVKILMSVDTPELFTNKSVERLPEEIIDYLPSGLKASDGVIILNKLAQFSVDDNIITETKLVRLLSLAKAYTNLPTSYWPEVIELYLYKLSENTEISEKVHHQDVLNILIIFIIVSQNPALSNNKRIKEIIEVLKHYYQLVINLHNHNIYSLDSELKSKLTYNYLSPQIKADIDIILSKWLFAQVVTSLFPFSGIGNTTYEKMLIISLKHLILKAVLLAYANSFPEAQFKKATIQAMQIVAKIFDHLKDISPLLEFCKIHELSNETKLTALLCYS